MTLEDCPTIASLLWPQGATRESSLPSCLVLKAFEKTKDQPKREK
jgi:hypothetical protein